MAYCGAEWLLAFHFNEPYCAYFKKHSSSWQMWLAGRLQQQLKTTSFVEVSVDEGRPVRVQTNEALRQPLRIGIPSGTRDHVWTLSPAR